MTTLDHTLDRALSGIRLLDHPFYRRWEVGGLTRDELTHYAEQYEYFEAELVSFLEQLSTMLPEGEARRAVLSNLRDETSTPSHLELFEDFATFYDARDVPASPAMSALVEVYRSLLSESAFAALAGLYAYETQGADIASTKAVGLATHYGATESALAFWDAHTILEGGHAAWTRDALDQCDVSSEVAYDGARRVGLAWWNFLDERELASAL